MKRFFAIATLTALAACAETPAETEGQEARETDGQQAGAQSLTTASSTESEQKALANAASPLCSAEETPIFSCKVESGKQLSVCGKQGGGAQYRFGPQDAAELVLDGGVWASVAYSGGGEAQLKFDSGDTSYIVFSRVVRTNFEAGEPNNPAFTDGVIILKGRVKIGEQVCDDPDLRPVDYNKAEELLEQANGLFTEVE